MKKFVALATLLLLTASALWAQKLDVTGSVIDGNGVPVVGASVVIKGKTTGTTTDAKGHFSLSASKGDVLTVSFIGYKPVEAAAVARMKITLEEESQAVDEVVVIGYGSVKKSDLTGSVSTIKADDLMAAPSHSVDQMLRGKAAGLQVFTGSNEPGASATIRIRGTSSVHGSNDPLYVVDGFPIGSAGNLKAISPEDIESIEVLKDASASAIYGSRGANGVIMITTKKGKAGQKAVINVSAQTAISNFAKKFDIITDPALYATLDNESYTNAGANPRYIGQIYDGVYYPSVEEIRNGTWKYGTDWADVVYRTGITQNYNLSITGSTNKTQYSISAGYFDQKGIQIGSDYDKITARVSLTQQVMKGVKAGADIFINNVNNHQTSGPSASRTPVFPVYDENGDYFMINSQDYYHPIALVDHVLNKGRSFDFYGIAFAEIDIVKGLVLRGQLGYNNGQTVTDSYSPRKYTYEGTLNEGVGKISQSNGNKLLPELFATYQNTFGKHYMSIMGGYTAEIDESRGLTGTGMGFVNDILQNEDLSAATTRNTSNSYSRTVLSSWIARANYTFDNRFLFTFTARADGSSKFGANNKWGFFPSGAVSWKIHEEKFMIPLQKYVSEAKIRVSYGLTGNQGISPYQTLDRIGNTTNYFLNGNGFVTGYGPGIMNYGPNYTRIWEGIGNKDLKWETTRQLNAGIDLGLFDNRLRVTFDYYNKYTVDLLRQSYLAPSSGSDRMWVNNGEVENRGWEVSLNGVLVSKKDFSWDMGIILSHNRNRIKKLEFFNDQGGRANFEYRDSNDDTFGGIGCSILQVGQPMGAFFGYVYDGLLQSEAEGLALGLTGLGAAAGEQKFKNLADLYDDNGNPISEGKIGTEDRVIIGNPEPKLTFALNTSVSYKGFDLTLNFNGVYGNDIFNKALTSSAKAKIERWTPDNTGTRHPRLRNQRVWYVSDYFIEDGSYLKLSNATLGYTWRIGSKWISKLRAYITGENLFTITNFTGYDPEVAANGIFSGGYPKQRTFTFGVNLTF